MVIPEKKTRHVTQVQVYHWTVHELCLKLLQSKTVQEAYTCNGEAKWLENFNLDQEVLGPCISHSDMTWRLA